MLYQSHSLLFGVARKIHRNLCSPPAGFLPLLAITLLTSTLALGQSIVTDSSQPVMTRLQWSKRTGVLRYRLQIAKDDQFNDVLFDGVVSGHEYVVKDLAPGRYYWRLTSVRTGKPRILRATPFEVKSDLTERSSSVTTGNGGAGPVRNAPTGWMATTGEISAPIAARLRVGSAPDIVGVNSNGTVYAIDSATGVPLWIARRNSRPQATDANTLSLVLTTGSNEVIATYDTGIRALEGATGRQLWATEFLGKAVGLLAADVDSRAGGEIYYSDAKLNQLVSLNATTGTVLRKVRLTDQPAGSPVLFQSKDARHFIVPLKNGELDILRANGDHLRTISTGGQLTTAPMVALTARGNLVLVGTSKGLVAFDANNFAPIGETVLDENDYPVGTLSAVRSDSSDVVDTLFMISDRGRVVAVNLADGSMKWMVEGFAHVAEVAFADLDFDGKLDILVPGNRNFATAFSASDGSTVWRSDEENRDGSQPAVSPHLARLTSIVLKDGRTIIVGSDGRGLGLRALQIGGIASAAVK